MPRFLFVMLLLVAVGHANAAPLAREAVPEVLKSWVPWVLHDQTMAACPPAGSDSAVRACVWPTRLEIETGRDGATFKLQAESFGAETVLPLPGDAEHWPQDVKLDGKPVPVLATDEQPVLRVAAGRHVVSGRFLWRELPPSLRVPVALGIVQIKSAAGWSERLPDEEGQVWLRAEEAAGEGGEAFTLRSFRKLDDDQPLRVASRFELTFAGKPREVVLPHALLAGFVPVSLNSPLPARLGADGSLRLQARAGQYVVEVEGRRMDRVMTLELPKDAGNEEVWSWVPHRELRVVELAGQTVDPKQAGVPGEWAAYPAYLLRPGQALKFNERRRGDPEPAPDQLQLNRVMWLDFDGKGFTVQDRISGYVSRAWRLEAQAPLALGHVASDGVDQYITRLTTDAAAGFELRNAQADIVADSRIEAPLRQMPIAGWNADFQTLHSELRLPPGWLLLHAGGVDRVDGSWLSAWTLWDFFFVLLVAFAAWKLHDKRTGVLLAVALVLSWQLPDSPGWLWLAALGFMAAARALAATRLAGVMKRGQQLFMALLLLQILGFGVAQLRMAVYPVLERGYAPFDMTAGLVDRAAHFEAYRDEDMKGAAKVAEPVAPQEAAAPAADAPPPPPSPDRALLSSISVAPEKRAKSEMRLGLNSQLQLDPGTRVQTGPGLPVWTWQSHGMSLQGPVSSVQKLDLWLLPPVVLRSLRVLAFLLLGLAFWRVFLRGFRLHWPRPALVNAAVVFCAVALLAVPAPPAQAASEASPTPPAPLSEGFQHWLDQLRDKLLAAPACEPDCIQVPRMGLEADAQRLVLRIEAHAAADGALPLPGQGTQLRVRNVLLDGQPASLRRDEEGQLWLHLTRGVHQVLLEANIADAPAVNLVLPLVPRHVEAKLATWALSGVNDNGVAEGAITLTRVSGGGKAASETTRDALPPLVRVERTLRLAERWTIDTRIVRLAPSLAPLKVVVPLLPGERVTDPGVQVQDGQAVLMLGSDADASFSSALSVASSLRLQAPDYANQVSLWRIDADTRWHFSSEGLAPVLHQQEKRLLPQWQPWPGESVVLKITRPQGVPGASLTLDSLELSRQPGQRMTEASARLVLRSSLGGSHVVKLPEGAVLQSVLIDGAEQPLQSEGRALNLPIHPGRQHIDIRWREALGVATWQESTRFDAGLPGVNVSTRLSLGDDRWILAVGGPLLGPAVLIWGTLLLAVLVAVLLGRSRLTPLGVAGWMLLGIGLAQFSLAGGAVVVLWFLALAGRARYGQALPRWAFNLAQLGLAAFSLAAFAIFLGAIHGGLLGSPDTLIVGNGSSHRFLLWYQDRFNGEAPLGWAFSLPMWAYRGLMLAWAIWLASGALKWLRWGWAQFATGGLWRAPSPMPAAGVAPVATGIEEEMAQEDV